jgi:hypothetical protein
MRIHRIGLWAEAAALALFLVAAWPVKAVYAQAYWGYGAGNRVWGYAETGQGWQGNGYGYVKECQKIRAATSAVAA